MWQRALSVGGGGAKKVVEGLLTNSLPVGTTTYTISGLSNIESIVINEGALPTMTGTHNWQSVSTVIDGVTYWAFNQFQPYPNAYNVTDITGNVVTMTTNAASGILYYRAIGT